MARGPGRYTWSVMGQRLSSMVGPAKWAAVGALVTATGAGALFAWQREPAPQAAALPPAPVVLPQREPVLLSQIVEKPGTVTGQTRASDDAVDVASAQDDSAAQAPPQPVSEPTPVTQPAPKTPPQAPPQTQPKPQPKPAPAPKPATPAVKPTPRFINVNTAGAAELELLPSIGPSLAKAIIDHRTKHGAFASLADLDKVPGIGPKTLEKLKDRVTFR